MNERLPLLIAAVSFEDRCLGAVYALLGEGRSFDMTILDYGSHATPGRDALALRTHNWERLQEVTGSAGVEINREQINPYAMGALEQVIEEAEADHSELWIDVSCFTRPHVLAAAVALSESRSSWRVAYTSPITYGDLNAPKSYGGWDDTLLLPLGRDPSLSREGVAIGILLIGHESDRAGVALDELEPASGLAISTFLPERPDLNRRAIAQHRALLDHLAALQMPGSEGRKVLPYFPSGGWESDQIALAEPLGETARVSKRILAAARALSAPVVLYPFGPKVLVFCFGILLAHSYPEASWAMYPVPRTHPITYSDGTAHTAWLRDTEVMISLDVDNKAGRSHERPEAS